MPRICRSVDPAHTIPLEPRHHVKQGLALGVARHHPRRCIAPTIAHPAGPLMLQVAACSTSLHQSSRLSSLC
jgi:hypothetical protein